MLAGVVTSKLPTTYLNTAQPGLSSLLMQHVTLHLLQLNPVLSLCMPKVVNNKHLKDLIWQTNKKENTFLSNLYERLRKYI